MNEAIEKLTSLLTQKRKLAGELQSKIQDLEWEIKALDGQIDGIEISIRAISTNETQPSQQPALIGKYSKQSLTPAIFDVINTLGKPPGLLTPEIVERLKFEGFKSDAKDLYSSAYAVAM